MKSCLKTWTFPTWWERHPAAKILSASPPLHRKSGFTLIEVIATIIAASILGLIFMNFMGTAMSRSVRSIELVKGEAAAEETMERIIADYVKKTNQDYDNALGFMHTEIKTNKRYGDNVSANYIFFDSSGKENEYSGSDEEEKRTLKVTISAEGNDLITLLTRSRGDNSPPVPF